MARGMIVNRVMTIGAVVIALGIMATSTSAQNTTAPKYTVHTLPLPDNGTGDVSMDYIAFDSTTNSLWVPVGNTGAVDVVDVATGKVRQIQNLPTAEVQAYESAAHLLYIGAARAAKLTIARADSAGKLTTVAQVPTQNGARNGVVTKDGTIYLAHGGGVKLPALVVVSPSK